MYECLKLMPTLQRVLIKKCTFRLDAYIVIRVN